MRRRRSAAAKRAGESRRRGAPRRRSRARQKRAGIPGCLAAWLLSAPAPEIVEVPCAPRRGGACGTAARHPQAAAGLWFSCAAVAPTSHWIQVGGTPIPRPLRSFRRAPRPPIFRCPGIDTWGWRGRPRALVSPSFQLSSGAPRRFPASVFLAGTPASAVPQRPRAPGIDRVLAVEPHPDPGASAGPRTASEAPPPARVESAQEEAAGRRTGLARRAPARAQREAETARAQWTPASCG